MWSIETKIALNAFHVAFWGGADRKYLIVVVDTDQRHKVFKVLNIISYLFSKKGDGLHRIKLHNGSTIEILLTQDIEDPRILESQYDGVFVIERESNADH